jgi:glucans biosynthesis protein C
MSSLPDQTRQEGLDAGVPLAQLPPQTTGSARLFFADHLRVALTILVVLHHLAVIYGANAAFYYLEPPKNDPVAFLVLLVFVLINQGYFMGFFFLISGYFTPGSFDHKGPASFLKDRLLRLGIPLLVFLLVLNPIASIGLYYWTSIKIPFISLYPGLIGVGPLWFVEMLLIFDVGYVVWRSSRRTHTLHVEREVRPPSYLEVGIFVLALSLASYLLRIVVPPGMFIPVFGFPTLSYLPQYLSFFILGVIAFRCNWLRTIPNSMGKVGFGMALGATILLFPLALSGGADFVGKGHWQSAVYALWDSTFSVGMCLGLITFFRRFFNRSGKLSRFLSRHAYAVYIIHAPVIVLLALALRGIHPEQLLKFALAALIGVPLCFALALLVRKIAFASRIL